jgi:DNA-3-methyladenine glycosylase
MLLPRSYFCCNDTPALAYDLVGKYLVRDIAGVTTHFLISEVEAYHGPTDLACHGRCGPTARNRVMFENGGAWYVYLCYGIHWLLNIVTGEEGYPAAVLIRGVNQVFGPGRVTKLLNITKDFYGKLAAPSSGLWIEDLGYVPQEISTTARIGIDYAGEYRDKPWRFVLEDVKKK